MTLVRLLPALFVVASTALAQLTTVSFSGRLTSSVDPFGLLPAQLSPDSTISGSFSYDVGSAVPDVDVIGLKAWFTTPSLTLDANGFTKTFGGYLGVSLSNDGVNSWETFTSIENTATGYWEGNLVVTGSAELFPMPLGLPGVPDAAHLDAVVPIAFFFNFYEGDQHWGAAYAIDSLTFQAAPSAVPEASTYGLSAAAVLAGLIAVRRRRRVR